MRKLQSAILSVGCVFLLTASSTVQAQRRTGTGSMTLGQRWGTPGGGPGQTYSPVPGRKSSSPVWTLRPTYRNSRSVTSQYNASLSNRSRSYSAAPGYIQYSRTPLRSSRYSYSGYQHVFPHAYIHYNGYGGPLGGYGFLNPYYQFQLLNGLSPVYGGIYPTIVAPPIVLPYGGYGGFGGYSAFGITSSAATYSRVPVGSTVVSPSALGTANLPLSGGISAASVPAASVGPAASVPATENSQMLSNVLPADETPIVNEFGNAMAVNLKEANAIDGIRSLRYQTSGDDAFRRKEYASAIGLYKAAADTAPRRRAPVLRLAWAQVAQQDYSSAVLNLKKVLQMPGDPTSSWIDGRNLYGSAFGSASALQSDDLWKWVQERPNSTDRLLLAAAFHKLRGYNGVSREILQTASRAGLDRQLEQALIEISTVDKDDAANRPPEPKDVGIRMRGSDVIPANQPAPPKPGLPTPGLPEALPADVDVPLPIRPQNAANTQPLTIPVPE